MSERQRICQEIECGQAMLYGQKISENQEESIASLELLCREFSEKGKKLDPQQTVKFLAIFDKLSQKVVSRWG